MHQKRLEDGLRPVPLGSLEHSLRSPSLRGRVWTREWERKSWGRGGKVGWEGRREGRGREGGISPPRSFLKVGAYGIVPGNVGPDVLLFHRLHYSECLPVEQCIDCDCELCDL